MTSMGCLYSNWLQYTAEGLQGSRCALSWRDKGSASWGVSSPEFASHFARAQSLPGLQHGY